MLSRASRTRAASPFRRRRSGSALEPSFCSAPERHGPRRRIGLAVCVWVLVGFLLPAAGFAEDRFVPAPLPAHSPAAKGLPQFEYDQPFVDLPFEDEGALASSPDASAHSRGWNYSGRIDRVRVRKSQRRLELLSGHEVVERYTIALGSNPVGAKRRQGDGRTPEGQYVIDWRKSDSDYHLALHVSYPDAEDKRRATARGEQPGGSIMIHGLPNGRGLIGAAHTLADWTDGCIAVTNLEIEEIWARVEDGTPIEILP